MNDMGLSAKPIEPGEYVEDRAVLAVSASAKPASGHTERSAVRGYTAFMVERLMPICPQARMLDLRTMPLPWFDGRLPSEIDNRSVQTAYRAVEAAGALLFAVPAYWQSVGAVFKNFCEVLAGPSYDLEGGPTVFAGKPTGLLVVGADADSASRGTEDAQRILASLGADVICDPVVVANPRLIAEETEWARLAADLVSLAGRTALAAQTSPASARHTPGAPAAGS